MLFSHCHPFFIGWEKCGRHGKDHSENLEGKEGISKRVQQWEGRQQGGGHENEVSNNKVEDETLKFSKPLYTVSKNYLEGHFKFFCQCPRASANLDLTLVYLSQKKKKNNKNPCNFWKTTFDGGQPLMGDHLWWMTIFDEKWRRLRDLDTKWYEDQTKSFKQSFLEPKIFPKPTFFSSPNFFWHKISFVPKFFSNQKFIQTNIFLTKIFSKPKNFFQTQHFFQTKNFFQTQNFF